MSYVTISKINETFLYVDASPSIKAELEDFFKFRPPNYQFSPKYKMKMWDGWIRLYSQHSQTLHVGLSSYLTKFCKDSGYSLQLSGDVEYKDSGLISEKQVVDIINNDLQIPEKYERRDYQINAIKHAINHNRAVLLSATGSGKSLMQYILVRFYQSMLEEDKKLVIIVPTTSLVHQMIKDFGEYSSEDDGWNVEDHVHGVMAGVDKETDKQIIVTTWQSAIKMPKTFFKTVGFINVDECHLAEANSIKKIAEACVKCKYRFGTTGTLKDSKAHVLTIEGLLGPAYSVATTVELMDRNILSAMKINCIHLQYSDAEKKALARKDYKTETDWIESNEKRCRFLAEMGDYFAKNTLFLFSHRSHGKSLYNELKKSKCPDMVYYVDGTVSAETREHIRAACEDESKIVYVVASYQTFSTGISINNLHNIVFMSSTKAPIRILQSIGRGLRKHKSKSVCNVYDIADDLRHKSWTNYSIRHAKERELIFIREGFNYSRKKIQL